MYGAYVLYIEYMYYERPSAKIGAPGPDARVESRVGSARSACGGTPDTSSLRTM